jgi:cytochrome P450
MIAWMDHIKTLLFAGHETSSHLLAWAVYQLVCDPSSQAQIRDGLRAGQSGLLDAFMQEVLRFRPPVWVYDRSTTEQIILSGYRLPKGAKVYISPFIFHRSERYFKNADTFILDRFVQQKAEGITAYIPFGLSSRVCIGKQVALTQVRSVLSDLLLKYRLEFASEKKVSVRMNPGATLGLKDRLSVRLQPLTD